MKEKIYNALLSLSPEKVTKTQLTLDGKVYTKKQLHKLKKIISKDMAAEDKIKLLEIEDEDFRDYVLEMLSDLQEEMDSGDYDDRYDVFSVMDSTKPDDFIVYDRENDNFKTTYRHLRNSLKTLGKIKVQSAIRVYDPLVDTNENKISDYPRQEGVKQINMYEVPSWREGSKDTFLLGPCSGSETASLPALARDFLHHFFPNVQARHYFYHWLYHALTKRNGNIEILVLQGPQGTGKNFLVDGIIKSLVGRENGAFFKAPNSAFGKFNSGFRHRRIVSVDEPIITRASYEELKKLTNNFSTFEGKGENADKEDEIFFSIVATMNTTGSWYLHYDDRRSSILEITDTRLDEVWSEETMREFEELLKDDDYIAEIGEFILTRSWVGKKEKLVPKLYQYKTEKFYRFVFDHLSNWQKKLIEEIFKQWFKDSDEKEVFDLTRFCNKLNEDGRRKYTLNIRTIESFILSYKHDGKFFLGEIFDGTDGIVGFTKKLKINEKLMKHEEEKRKKNEDDVEDLL